MPYLKWIPAFAGKTMSFLSCTEKNNRVPFHRVKTTLSFLPPPGEKVPTGQMRGVQQLLLNYGLKEVI
jgi:hypothetical protein